MYRQLRLLALLSLATACAPTSHTIAYREVAPKASAGEVEVYTDSRPDRAFEEIGTIEVAASELSDDHYGDLIRRARREGARMGGDAILVTRDPQERTTVTATVPPRRKGHVQFVAASARTVETARIRVAVVVWKGGE